MQSVTILAKELLIVITCDIPVVPVEGEVQPGTGHEGPGGE